MFYIRTLSLLSLLSLPAAYAAPSGLGASVSVEPTDSKVSAAWYGGWNADDFPLSTVSWKKYTHMMYSFAETTPDINTLSLAASHEELVPVFVATARANGVKAIVSIGGWTGSRWFSSNIASAANRTAFAKTVLEFAETYDLDGIEFAWSYPNNQGIGCNTINSADTANFLAFLQELRADDCGANLIISSATPIFPWKDASGNPSTDVAGFAKVLDWVSIMNYDVWGSWSTAVGPNSPLDDTCAAAADQQGSAVSAVKQWTAAGMPKDKIVLGVAGYGHSFSVSPSSAFQSNASSVLAAYPAFNATNKIQGDKWDGAPGVDECGASQGPGGVFNFWGLIDAGFLTPEGKPAKGISYRFDNCSQTAYVYNEASQVMVSFDDAQAFKAKGGFIKSSGLRGFALWETGSDSKDILLNSILGGIGA